VKQPSRCHSRTQVRIAAGRRRARRHPISGRGLSPSPQAVCRGRPAGPAAWTEGV